MNVFLLVLFLPTIVVCLVMKYRYHTTIAWWEMGIQLTIPMILIAAIWNISKYSQMADTEILNGHVTDKKKVLTSCEHSYSCNCRTVTSGSGRNLSTTTQCDTCYEHSNDWDWTVYTTVGDFNVDRVDSQGSYEPKRWTKVTINDPVAKEHIYTNYIQAAPDSLFHVIKAKQYDKLIPQYPHVYDYQFADRVIPVGFDLPNKDRWNRNLANALVEIGEKHQGNVIVILTQNNPGFAEAVRGKWVGSKKNDILIIIGTKYPSIKWVKVYSWAKHDIVNVALRNALLSSRTLNPDTTIQIISDKVNRYYERRPMAEFAYLEDEVIPPTWVMILAFILGIGSSILIGLWCHEND